MPGSGGVRVEATGKQEPIAGSPVPILIERALERALGMLRERVAEGKPFGGGIRLRSYRYSSSYIFLARWLLLVMANTIL